MKITTSPDIKLSFYLGSTLGSNPSFKRDALKSAPYVKRQAYMVRYELDNGEEMHADAPETFYLPPLEARKNLKPNDTVKLVFRIEHDNGFDVERMWVDVKNVTPTGYIGVLDNDPYCTEELKSGEVVEFEPKHIIQIYEP